MFWQSLFNFLEKIGVSIFGWKLSQKTYNKQLLVDTIKQKFDALREIKSTIENIPPNLSKQELAAKLKSDPDFCENLTNRLVRIFGLRNEFIPFIETEFIDLINKRLEPLYIIENGTYIFREEKIEDFATFAMEAKSLVASI